MFIGFNICPPSPPCVHSMSNYAAISRNVVAHLCRGMFLLKVCCEVFDNCCSGVKTVTVSSFCDDFGIAPCLLRLRMLVHDDVAVSEVKPNSAQIQRTPSEQSPGRNTRAGTVVETRCCVSPKHLCLLTHSSSVTLLVSRRIS